MVNKTISNNSIYKSTALKTNNKLTNKTLPNLNLFRKIRATKYSFTNYLMNPLTRELYTSFKFSCKIT